VIYHYESQYPHIDLDRVEYERVKPTLDPPMLYMRQFGSVGTYRHVPVFVDGCPDERARKEIP
jgi:hypothetical protein